jgi:cobalt-zinc-cadmium efflux system outer membrane protein
MRMHVLSALALAAGCGGSLGSVHDQYRAQLDALRRSAPARDDAPLFVDAKALDRAALIDAALARNPDVESARQGWRAALAEVDAATALDDPMLTYEVAPLSIASDAPFGQRVEVSQKLPWPGKRALAGEAALAEADAARGDYEAMRLETAAMASSLFDDYYLVARSLEVNDHHRELVERMKKSAEAQLTIGRGAEQDSLSAEVELGRLEHEHVMLETERDAVIARMNGLLHRDPDTELPPPPADLPMPAEPGSVDELEHAAIQNRPQEASARATVRARKASVALARKDYYPDFDVMTSYDSMWDMPEHRWMVGVSIDVPLQRGKRRAAVEAAEARTAQAEAQVDEVSDTIRVEVTSARRDVMESVHLAKLYDEKILPAARDEVDAALAGYTSGQNDFSAVMSAEKDLRDVELESYQARAELWQRMTALDRAIGRIPGSEP